MKKLTILLLVIGLSQSLSAQLNRQALRNLFLKAIDHKHTLDSFSTILENKQNRNFLEDSYLGMCYALKAGQATGNFAKIKLVWKAHRHLNNSIAAQPNDPEPRFFRFMLEHHLPSFLGLNKDIPADLQVIFKQPNFLDDNLAMKKKVIEFLLWTNRCNASQIAQLKGQLAKL